jgi:hypothetical protein
MAENTISRVGYNVIFFAVIVATTTIGLMCVYDHGYDVGVLDSGLNTVSVGSAQTLPESFKDGTGAHAKATDAPAVAAKTAFDKFAAGGDFDVDTAQANHAAPGTAAGKTPADLQADLKKILEQRMKYDYRLTTTGLVWQGALAGGTRPKLHEPEDTIDFQFDNLNDGWTGCLEPADGVFTPYNGLSPNGTDLTGRCSATAERAHTADRDGCKESWLYLLYSDGGPIGLTTDDKWIDDVCEFQKTHWSTIAGFLIASVTIQMVYYAYWAYFTVFGSGQDLASSSINLMRLLSGCLIVCLFVTLGFFAASRHKMLSHEYGNGLQDKTTAEFGDDTALSSFPARAKMYEEAHKLCYGDTVAVKSVAPDAGTPGCASFETFKQAMNSLKLFDAGACAFGASKDTFESPVDACNLPGSFADYGNHHADGPEFTIIDKRTATIGSTTREIDLITIDRDTYGVYGVVIGGLVIWLAKEIFVFAELFIENFSFLQVLVPCISTDQRFTVAGGYAGAV